MMPRSIVIVSGYGKHGRPWQMVSGAVRTAVLEMLRLCGVPLLKSNSHESSNPGKVQLDMRQLEGWIDRAILSGLVYGAFETTDLLVLDIAPLADKIMRRAT
eukprot:6187460-Pleurochrysis_carterae.AAC.6